METSVFVNDFLHHKAVINRLELLLRIYCFAQVNRPLRFIAEECKLIDIHLRSGQISCKIQRFTYKRCIEGNIISASTILCRDNSRVSVIRVQAIAAEQFFLYLDIYRAVPACHRIDGLISPLDGLSIGLHNTGNFGRILRQYTLNVDLITGFKRQTGSFIHWVECITHGVSNIA